MFSILMKFAVESNTSCSFDVFVIKPPNACRNPLRCSPAKVERVAKAAKEARRPPARKPLNQEVLKLAYNSQ